MDCLNKIISEYEGRMKPEEIEAIYERVRNKMKWGKNPVFDDAGKRVDTSNMSPDELMRHNVEQVFKEDILRMANYVKNKYRAAEVIDRGMKEMADNNQRGNVRYLIETMTGDAKGRQKEMTLEGRKNAILQTDSAQMGQAFEDYMTFWGANLTDEQAKSIVREFDQPGGSGDKTAKGLVEQWLVWAGNARKLKNDLGADIGYRADWRLPQSWDSRAVRVFGLSREERIKFQNPLTSLPELQQLREKARENFVTEALKRVDPLKYTDAEGAPLDQTGLTNAMRTVFQTITTEGLNKGTMAEGVESLGVAGQLAAHRELHFKDAQSWYELNTLAGSRDILGIMQATMVKHARDTALLETLSPHNNVVFNTLLSHAEAMDAVSGNKVKKDVWLAKNIYAELSGTASLPISERGAQVAQIMQGWRNWMTATKLGGVLLSQVSDLATYNVLARTNGLGMGRAMEFWFKSLNPANAADRIALSRAGVASDMMLHDVAARVGEAVQGKTLSSTVANTTLRAAGMNWWSDGGQRAFQALIGFHLADIVKGGGETDAWHFNKTLERYGIYDKEMEIIKQAQPVEIMGHEMITPTSIKLLGDTPEIREVAIKVAAMMGEESRLAILSPGAHTKAILHGSSAPGTLAGELLRTGSLFKSFSVGMITQVLPRVYAAEGTSAYRAGIVAQYVLSMMVSGAVSLQLRTMARGLNPRDMSDPLFWVGAGAQSGGLGIFGDFVFADRSRMGHDLGTTLAGPVAGSLDDFLKLTLGNAFKAGQGKKTDFLAEAMQFTKNDVLPYVNLFYTRAALDHMIFFTAQEAANPGYLRRMKQGVENANNTTWYWPPQDPLPHAPDFDYAFHGKRSK
jgi:hypothetical protein